MAEHRAAVIGHPIAHSLSPALFAEFARAGGIDLDYRAVDVHPDALATTLMTWRDDAQFVGCNVTMPHKEHIIALLDDCAGAARATSAVNVVRRQGAGFIGDNTDVAGIGATFDSAGFEVGGSDAVVFGAGGGARAVTTVLGDRGAANVTIVARTVARAHALCEDASKRSPATAFVALEMTDAKLAPAQLYVNATPLGQTGQPARDLLPVNAPASSLAFDLVYRPAATPFLAHAAARGLTAIGGFTMLLEQALATFDAWFGFRPQLDATVRTRLERLAA
ncbi:MAG: shikimate dehydrogenase family protein [Vulcanimicrobiaceae bacterium]